MPLHADLEEGLALASFVLTRLEGLDQTIFTPGDGAVRSREGTDALMVEAVDLKRAGTQDASELALRCDAHAVMGLGGPGWMGGVGDGTGSLGWKMSLELAAAKAREELHAVADAEDRPLLGKSGLGKGAIEFDLGFRGEVEHATGQRRITRFGREIVASGQKQTIDAGDERFGASGLNREVLHEAAGLFDRAGISSVEVVIASARSPATAVVKAKRNPDSRSLHGDTIAICGILGGWHRW